MSRLETRLAALEARLNGPDTAYCTCTPRKWFSYHARVDADGAMHYTTPPECPDCGGSTRAHNDRGDVPVIVIRRVPSAKRSVTNDHPA